VSDVSPQPGFQEQFLSCTADIAIAGGSAGCGKSWASVYEAARFHDVPGFAAILFRRTSPELVGAGSIWEESLKLYPRLGGVPREHRLDWRFPSGASIEFRHLQYDGDRLSHQSKQYALILFEEICHFTESQFWYLISRARSTCGVRPYVRATCNPDPDSFVAKLIAWWIDQDTGLPIPERAGVLRWFVRSGDDLVWASTPEELRGQCGEGRQPKSLTFVPGKLEDNQILVAKDPAYRAWLESLPLVDRERLLGGNWKIKPAAGLYFKREYFTIVDEVPGDLVNVVRCWDKAATEPSEKNRDPDYTAGVKLGKLRDGRYIVLHVARAQSSPGKVDSLMQRIAKTDGNGVTAVLFQDPGQAGKVDVAHMRRVLDGYSLRVTRPTKDKVTFAGPFSAQAEGGNVLMLRGEWNDQYISEHEAFPEGSHDDQVDATAGAYDALRVPELVYVSGGG
jgi:predicted phage terminase large subunit-like protein